ncbi:MAG TPA: phospholipase D-like domain-containing protein [Propionibacteriaceae bacterium]|nr:phospholipase D-like domain-containing protein [Propionibacteriaceae bacterium]
MDEAAGRLLESRIRTHHRHRMARNGSPEVLDLDDGAGDTSSSPLRHGNSVEVLIDGDAAFRAMLDTIRSARRSVQIAGWHAMPEFALTRGDESVTLRDALADAASRATVQVLIWGGAQVPVMHPTRADARRARDGFLEIPGVAVELDHREYLQHCHHEKLLVVDDEVAYVGGLDLTHLTNDRWDTEGHEPRESLGWHDAAVRLRGPVVADVASHINARWHEVTGERVRDPEPPAPAGPYDVTFVRTVPERIYGFRPHGEFSILAAYRRALAAAQHLVYLENQFLWAPEIVDILEDKLVHPPSADFRMILLLPRRPATGRDTTLGQLSRLVQADVDRRLLAATLQSLADESPGTYVHAKVGIVDDHWLTIGSANLNAHSLFNDTEANIIVTEPQLVRETRLRLWREHLGMDDVEGDPTRLFDDAWVRIADEQLARRRDGKPPTHRVCRLEDVSARRDLVLGGLLGLIVDG